MSILTQSAEYIARACDGILEQDCLLCGASSGNTLICAACANDLPRLPGGHCPQCALPGSQGERCGRCLSKPPHYDATFAVFAYEFPLDKLIQSFKYSHRLAPGNWLGQQLAAGIASSAAAASADLIIPLPLHPLRLRERGFNQALELARPVSAVHGWPIDAQSCSRIRHTPAQAELPWRERIKNIRGAFHCAIDLRGKNIILVDDVMTTGASLNECARTLKLHGAAQVSVLVAARALPKSG